MFFTLAGAGACALFGVQEYRLSARSSQEPEEVSLRDLIKRGPEGNPNIILKDFSIFEDYVYQKKLVSGRWTKVWVPIVPTDGDEAGTGRSAAIHAFLFSEDVGSEKEVRQRFDRPKLRGMVDPDAPKPGIVGSVLIRRSYPGTDPSKCIIIVEGKEPAGVLKLGLFSVGFVVLIVLTGFIWYLARQLDKVEVETKPADKNQPSGRKHQEGSESVLDVLPADDADDRPPAHDRRT
jgi:hypothetical protein